MRHFDGDYVEDVVSRLGAIRKDAVPRWGELTRDRLIEHLIWSLRHAMGRSRTVPFFGNCLHRYVTRPLVLAGAIALPRDMGLPAHLRAQGIVTREPGDLETLQAILEEYLSLVQADELQPAPHPAFGHLGIDGWDRFHVLHFDHHLRQFE